MLIDKPNLNGFRFVVYSNEGLYRLYLENIDTREFIGVFPSIKAMNEFICEKWGDDDANSSGTVLEEI